MTIERSPVVPVEEYLKQIHYPLLSPEEGKSIGETIKLGRTAQEKLLKNTNLVRAEREELYQQIEEGKEAARTMTEHNLGLVVNVAKEYLGRGVPFLDLIQEGNLGLMKAVEKFDPERGSRLSTYASFWIHQKISQAILNQKRTIRLSRYANESLRRIYRAQDELRQETGEEPTRGEISDLTEISLEKIEFLLNAAEEPLSLEQLVGEDKSELGDFIADEKIPSPEEVSEKALLREAIRGILNSDILSSKEREILKLRFGLENGRELTSKEIGEGYGITRQRVLQIQVEAFRKLRHLRPARELLSFL